MRTELRWIASLPTSCVHAGAALAHGRALADTKFAATIAEPAEALIEEIRVQQLPEILWSHLLGLSSGIHSSSQLAEVALAKTIGDVPDIALRSAQLATCLSRLFSVVRAQMPALLDQLELRGRPLREQWDARGPGMLFALARVTEAPVIAERADALLVHPALGGAGGAHLSYNSVRIEAVLASPHAELPEAVRLAWMLAQLQLDLPRFSEAIHRDRLPLVAQIAMLPAALHAGENVELCRFDAATMSLALEAWAIETPAGLNAVETAMAWWDTYQATRPPLSVALAALDRMCG